MSVLILLVIISLVVAVSFLIAFAWSVKNGQFEDDYTPAVRMLFEEEVQSSKACPTTGGSKVQRSNTYPFIAESSVSNSAKDQIKSENLSINLLNLSNNLSNISKP